ncbi:hypothetical protein [Ectothiorhodospira magna]|uniref:hypothetical protein n=1 Tax=Ectothiorhodospira magna TaxID=867345 RepID=UPI000B7D7743|nr:hypothetical protein [Ectothiorhodospira magna]
MNPEGQIPWIPHLLVPGLLTSVSQWQIDHGDIGRYPALEWLWSRGRPVACGADGLETLLCRYFGANTPAPVGALTRLAVDEAMAEGYWFRAEPVHLTVGTDDLILSEVVGPSLTAAENDALVTRINTHFQSRPWRLLSAAPGHWHLYLETDPGLTTVPLSQVLGRRVGPWQPQGMAAQAWQRDLTELQMLLFDAPENQAREARGLLPVNSLWLWGGGAWPVLASPRSWDAAFGDHALLAGCCRWSGTPLYPVPDSALSWLATGKTHGPVLVVLEDVQAAVLADDVEAWMAAMNTLERTWFEPLRQAVVSGRIGPWVIQGEEGRGVWLDGRSRWRWWRRPRPWS